MILLLAKGSLTDTIEFLVMNINNSAVAVRVVKSKMDHAQ